MNKIIIVFLIQLISCIFAMGEPVVLTKSIQTEPQKEVSAFSQAISQDNPKPIDLKAYYLSIIPQSVIKQILDKNIQIKILDIREPREFAKGHLPTATNLDYYDPNFFSRFNELNPTEEYIIYCSSTKRSLKAMDYLKKIGFYRIMVMQGGFEAWQASGFLILN